MPWDIAAAPDELALLMEAGMIYRDTGNLREAREVFTGVRALTPQSEVPEVALGTIAFQEQDYDAAERHYKRAIESNPKSAFAYAHLGELQLFQKNEKEARESLGKAVELDPRGDAGKMARTLLGVADAMKWD